MAITLFDSGKNVLEGDIFIAKIDSIEGHRRVTLQKMDINTHNVVISKDDKVIHYLPNGTRITIKHNGLFKIEGITRDEE